MSTGTAPSLSQNVTPLDTGAHVTGIGWLKGTAAFGLGDGGVLLAKDGESQACWTARSRDSGGEEGWRSRCGATDAHRQMANRRGRSARLAAG